MMIKKNKIRFADGSVKTQILTCESYRPAKGQNPRQRVIQNYGYLEDKENPEEFLKELQMQVKQIRDEKAQISIPVDFSRKNNSERNRDYNYAPFLLSSLYSQLKLDTFFQEHRNSKADYDLESIFRYLLTMTLVFPDSKRSCYMDREHIYQSENTFRLHHVYRALDEIVQLKDELDSHLDNTVSSLISRDKSYCYLDTTNFYQEKDFPVEDTLGQRGVSKEHRTEPIIQVGLLLDNNGIPFYSEVFAGNTADSLILKPMIENIRKKKMSEGRIIVVADKGLNSNGNIDLLVNNGDGYLFSQIIKGKKGKRYHSYLEDDTLFTYNEDRSYKYRLFEEEYEGKDAQGNPVSRKRKVLLYWNKAEAEMAKRKREEKIVRAQKSLANKAYTIAKGADAYLKKGFFLEDTGEFETKEIDATLDDEKIKEEEKFDGYFCLVSSEMDYDEKKMREVYHHLWMIEESFRIMKSDENLRPVYLSSDEHIRAHVHIVQIALLFIRLIQSSMKERISAERIRRVFENMVLDIPANGLVHLHEVSHKKEFISFTDSQSHKAYKLKESGKDEVYEDFLLICQAFNIDIDKAYMRQEVFNKEIKKAHLSLQKS